MVQILIWWMCQRSRERIEDTEDDLVYLMIIFNMTSSFRESLAM